MWKVCFIDSLKIYEPKWKMKTCTFYWSFCGISKLWAEWRIWQSIASQPNDKNAHLILDVWSMEQNVAHFLFTNWFLNLFHFTYHVPHSARLPKPNSQSALLFIRYDSNTKNWIWKSMGMNVVMLNCGRLHLGTARFHKHTLSESAKILFIEYKMHRAINWKRRNEWVVVGSFAIGMMLECVACARAFQYSSSSHKTS